MPVSEHTVIKKCGMPNCEESYPDHRWGKTKAHDAGWFFSRNGNSFCPKHAPAWLDYWRKNK